MPPIHALALSTDGLNESPSEKEGKFPVIVRR